MYMNAYCIKCGDDYDYRRLELGFRTCLTCGESAAKQVKHCVVPMHKSNYVLITDRSLLLGINNKTLRS